MMKRPLYVVDAFTTTHLDGNPAGVVPWAEGLGDVQMQAVARQVNVSETAFIFEDAGGGVGEGVDFSLRFFTPEVEVPFCGHAFLASVVLMAELGRVEVEGEFKRLIVETKAGRHPTDLKRDGSLWRVEATQSPPAFRPVNHPADLICSTIGINPEMLDDSLPLELAYTGLWHLIVPLKSPEMVKGAEPDYKAIASLNEEMGAVTTHLFAPKGNGFYARDFACTAGVDEDPVTGSASGAMGAYLVKNRVCELNRMIEIEQRDRGGRGGYVTVRVEGDSIRTPSRVIVGGNGVITITGEIEI